MSKLTKFKSGGVILALFLLGLFSGNAWGQGEQTYTYEFTSIVYRADGVQNLNGVDWNLACTWQNGTYYGNDGSKGQQIGSKSNPAETIRLSTDGIQGNVKSIKVSTSGASSVDATLQVSVGGTRYGNAIELTSSSTEYEFAGTGSGTIELLYNVVERAVYIKAIEVVYEQGAATQVTAPVLTPGSTNFTDQLTVTATCATDGATIYYTTDGSEPTTGSAVFPAEGLTLTETTTVKAMAANGELENSNVAEETYTKVTAMSIAEFKALENNAEGMLDLTGAVVTAVGSSDIFVQDAEGNGIDLYCSNQDWNVGDVLSGVASGSFVLYNNMPEFSNGDFSGVTATPGTGVAPKVVTIAELLANPETYYCTLVKVEGVTCNGETFTQDENSVEYYNRFRTIGNDYEFPATADVTGVFSPFGDRLQLSPRSEADVEDATGLEYPEFAWSMASVSVDINNVEAAVYPTLTNTSDGAVTYASSKEGVATIDAGGNITIVGLGTTMITASVAATATFNGAETVYTLRVIDPSALPEATAFVSQMDGVYYAMTTTLNDGVMEAATVNVVNNKVVNTGDLDPMSISWVVDAAAGTIATADGTSYLAGKSSGTDLDLSDKVSDLSTWTWSDENSTWMRENRSFIYRTGANGFKNYAKSNLGTQDYATGYTLPMPIVNGYTRTVSAGNYGTICLPYAVAAGDFAGVEFYSVAGKLMNGGQPSAIVLAPVTELEAGVPYIFSATDDQLLAAYSGDRAEAASANGLVGTFEYIDVAKGMYMISSANKVQLCGTGCTLGANRAYINMAEVAEVAEAGANMRVISLDGTVTGIDGVEAGGNQLVDVYTISGVRVRAQVPAAEATDGLQGGLYIVNGKKVAVK